MQTEARAARRRHPGQSLDLEVKAFVHVEDDGVTALSFRSRTRRSTPTRSRPCASPSARSGLARCRRNDASPASRPSRAAAPADRRARDERLEAAAPARRAARAKAEISLGDFARSLGRAATVARPRPGPRGALTLGDRPRHSHRARRGRNPIPAAELAGEVAALDRLVAAREGAAAPDAPAPSNMTAVLQEKQVLHGDERWPRKAEGRRVVAEIARVLAAARGARARRGRLLDRRARAADGAQLPRRRRPAVSHGDPLADLAVIRSPPRPRPPRRPARARRDPRRDDGDRARAAAVNSSEALKARRDAERAERRRNSDSRSGPTSRPNVTARRPARRSAAARRRATRRKPGRRGRAVSGDRSGSSNCRRRASSPHGRTASAASGAC